MGNTQQQPVKNCEKIYDKLQWRNVSVDNPSINILPQMKIGTQVYLTMNNFLKKIETEKRLDNNDIEELQNLKLIIKQRYPNQIKNIDFQNIEGIKWQLEKFKEVCSPIKIPIIKKLMQCKEIHNRKTVFVFGSSKDDICDYFKTINVGRLQKNAFIAELKPQIQCFAPIYHEDKVIYPFPTFSGPQEPLELQLFCDSGFQQVLRTCKEFGVIALISNPKDIMHIKDLKDKDLKYRKDLSTYRSLNTINKCFKGNMRQVLQNLTIYHPKVDQGDVVKCVRSFFPQFNNLSKINYSNTKSSLNNLKFIQKLNNQIRHENINQQIQDIFKSEIQLKLGRATLNFKQQKQHYFMQKMTQLLSPDNNIAQQVKIAQIKQQLNSFKEICAPIKMPVLKELIESKKIDTKKAVFVFGSSKDDMCDYFKTINVGRLQKNAFIAELKPQIQCFAPIYHEDKVIYPFPTFSGPQEPLELQLFCDSGFQQVLRTCEEFGVIALISNPKDLTTYRCLNTINSCFMINIKQVLQNLTIYHPSNVVHLAFNQNLRQFFNEFHDLSKINYSNTKSSLKNLRFIKQINHKNIHQNINSQRSSIIAALEFKQKKQQQFMQKILQFQSFENNIAQQVKIAQIKQQLNSFKEICAPIKMPVLKELIESKKIDTKKAVFVFGSSKDDMCDYFKTINVGRLQKNAFIAELKPQIQCFAPIYHEDKVIYPFPTFSGPQEPLELQLFCDSGFQQVLRTCKEFGVIALISNPKDIMHIKDLKDKDLKYRKDLSTYRSLNTINKCFKGNMRQVLQNLTIYHPKVDQGDVVKCVRSFFPQFNNLSKINYSNTKSSLNNLKFIQKLNNQIRHENINQQIQDIFKSEIQLKLGRATLNFKQQKQHYFMQKMIQLLSPDNNIAQQVKIAQIKQQLNSFKEICAPIKMPVLKELIEQKKIDTKKAVFVFGSSKDDICDYFKTINVGRLQKNAFIAELKPQIQCFAPIYHEDKVIYPFPTFSGPQEPLELQLFCDSGFQQVLRTCKEFGVIALISNPKDIMHIKDLKDKDLKYRKDLSTYRSLNTINKCFKGNMRQVLQNLTIYHPKVDQGDVVKCVRSFFPQFNNLSKINYSNTKSSLNNLKFIQKLNNQIRHENINQQIQDIFKSEIQLKLGRATLNFKQQKQHYFMQKMIQLLSPDNNIAQQVKIAQIKQQLNSFKEICAPIKMPVLKELIESKKIDTKKAVFVFGSSKDDMCDYFKTINVGRLQKNAFIAELKPQIQCFAPIYHEDKVIYPFPTFSGPQEPLELQLFCDSGFQQVLKQFKEFGVIALISNTKDLCTYRPLNTINKCFRGNIKQVLQNLTIYHHSQVDQGDVVNSVINYSKISDEDVRNSLRLFYSSFNNLQRIRYFNSKNSLENCLFIHNINHQTTKQSINQQIKDVFQSEISLILTRAALSLKQKKPQPFIDQINLLQPYAKLIPNIPKINSFSQFKNIFSANINSIKSNFSANFQLIQPTNQQKIMLLEKDLNFLRQLFKTKSSLCNFDIDSNIVYGKIKDEFYEKLYRDTRKRMNELRMDQQIGRQPNRNQLVINVIKDIEKRSQIFDQLFSKMNIPPNTNPINPNFPNIDPINPNFPSTNTNPINPNFPPPNTNPMNSVDQLMKLFLFQILQEYGTLKGKIRKQAQQEIKLFWTNAKWRDIMERTIKVVRQRNFGEYQLQLDVLLSDLEYIINNPTTQRFSDISNRIQIKRREYEQQLQYDDICNQKYQKISPIIYRIKQIYDSYVSRIEYICDTPLINNSSQCNQLARKLNIMQKLRIFEPNSRYRAKKNNYDDLLEWIKRLKQLTQEFNKQLSREKQDIKNLRRILQNIQKGERFPRLKQFCQQQFIQIKQKVNKEFKITLNLLIKIYNYQDSDSNQNILQNYEAILDFWHSSSYITHQHNQLIRRYQQKKKQFIKIIRKIQNLIRAIKIQRNHQFMSQANRKDQYQEIQQKILQLLRQIKENEIYKNTLRRQCEMIRRQVQRLYNRCLEIIRLMIINQFQKTEFEFNYNNLRSMDKYIRSSRVRVYIIVVNVNDIDYQLMKKLEAIQNEVKLNLYDVKKFVDGLLRLQFQLEYFFYMRQNIKELINQLVKQYVNRYKNVNDLGGQLQKSTQGAYIIEANSYFSQYRARQDKKKRFTQSGIKYVWDNISVRNGTLDKQALIIKYQRYKRLYDGLIKQYNNFQRQMNIKVLVQESNTKFKLPYDEIKFKKSLQQLPQLLAYVSAIWTLLHLIKLLANNPNMVIDADVMFELHPAQVVAIFRIFQFQSGLQNHLVQILTGQGKSIVLAFCSIIFALKGFQVNCVCYSQYLSKRDKQAFADLFKAFELSNQISYISFLRLLDQNGQISKLIGNFFQTGDYTVLAKSNLQKVILIDQVDIFFSNQIYGEFYQPIFTLKDDQFKELVDFIWTYRYRRNDINKIKWQQVKQYNNFVNKYTKSTHHSKNKDLIDQAVKQLIYQLQHIDSAPDGYYDQQKDQIGFKYLDGIDYNLYNYKILFTYYKMRDQRKINDQTVRKNTKFKLSCGKYSYAQIAQKFKFIVGVTGTLKEVNQKFYHILQQKYNIKKFTYIPSVYGRERLRFDPSRDFYLLSNKQGYYKKLKELIRYRHKNNQPVLVFFESADKLISFVDSYSSNEILSSLSYYTERADDDQRNQMIQEATRYEKITFLVRKFGQDTDFKCFDKNIQKEGLHVIQAFFSEDLSEDIQIKAKTARYGQNGSYQLIIQQYQLSKLKTDLRNLSYNRMIELRKQKYYQRYERIYKQTNSSKIINTMTKLFYEYLINKKKDLVMEGLLEYNKLMNDFSQVDLAKFQQKVKQQFNEVKIEEGNRQLRGEADRKDYYQDLETKINQLIRELKEKEIYLQLLRRQCEMIRRQVQRLYNRCLEIIRLMIINQFQKTEFEFNYNNLRSMDKYIRSSRVRVYIIVVNVNDIDYQLMKKLEAIQNEVKLNLYDVKKFVDGLLRLQFQLEYFFYMRQNIKELINQLVKQYVNRYKNVNDLGGQLQKSTQGAYIIEANSYFSQYRARQDKKKRFTQSGIKYVWDNISVRNGTLDKQALIIKYQRYKRLYDGLIKQYNNFQRQMNIKVLVQESNTKFKLPYDEIKFKKSLQQLPQLLAYVSAIWTLLHLIKLLANNPNMVIDADVMFELHPAQVVAIFRIFQFQSGLQNHLVQILTGQGKSIVLAFCSIIFALKGFQVNCVCYSQYLSKRDKQAFADLFKAFELQKQISYDNFKKLSDDILNEEGIIRTLVEEFFKTGDYTVSNQSSKLPKVMIIDQVDVFFSNQIYGKFYRPCLTFDDDQFKELVQFIWTYRYRRNDFNKIKWQQVKQYNNFVNKYTKSTHHSKNKDLINQIIQQLFYKLRNIDSARDGYYDQQKDQIGFKYLDGIDYNVYSYEILFTYYKMRDQLKIKDSTVRKNTKFTLSCGKYSYAQIPQKFKFVVGVTGTLKEVNQKFYHILQYKYNIKKFTYIPSVYGGERLRFDPSRDFYLLSNKQGYYKKLIELIRYRYKNNQPVLVFFESADNLKNFVNTYFNSIAQITCSIRFYTERADDDQRNQMIQEATRYKSITFLVREFGRGIDFKCLDKDVLKQGKGVHVIQAFLSVDPSEQIQIKGRTARQGQNGSYQLIVQQDELSKLDINKTILTQNQGYNYYSMIESRKLKSYQSYQKMHQQEKNSKIIHDQSRCFYNNLIIKNKDKLMEGLLKYNRAQMRLKNL